MIRLVALGGTGDVYLLCALLDGFRRHHQRGDVRVVLRSKFAAVADLFTDLYIRDDALVTQAENDLGMQQNYLNPFLSDTEPFYAHPCFVRSPTRVDWLTTKPDASQADMYRMILHLPAEVPLTQPVLPPALTDPNTVLTIRDAISWPNTQEQFWDMLTVALVSRGRSVIANDKSWSLSELLHRCLAAEWVIGPQCGVMSILCTAQFPCRKTLATPNVDGYRAPGFLAPETYPYAYVTKFSNTDYDVEEFKVGIENRAEIAEAIATGANAQRLWPHNPKPVQTVMLPTTPGDALDRLAVLTVKRAHFPPNRRAAIERDYQRHLEVTRLLRLDPRIEGLFARLVEHHEAAYAHLEAVVPAAMNGGAVVVEQHVAAIRHNRERVDLKREIDWACHAPYTEVKSYYGPEGI